jgi:hypothetical protein
LSAIDNVDDLNRMREYPIHHDERKRRQRQLPRAIHAAHSAAMRKRGERACALVDLPSGALCGGGIVPPDVSNDSGEIVRCFRRPPNLHLRMEQSLDSLSYLFVREVFATVELFQPLLNLLAKPCIVVEIMFHKLLNVSVRVAAILSGDAIQFHLQVVIEMYFHRVA